MNLTASGPYPFVQFQPTDGDSIFHTDQEYSDASNNSYLFRAYNAEFNGTDWQIIPDGPQEAYASAQNPDGSIHYYSNYNPATSTFESTWPSWYGSDNNTIYNAEDFGVTADIFGGTAAGNSAALEALFTVMPNATGLGGGTARITQYKFLVNAWYYDPTSSAFPPIVPPQSVFQALGTGGQNSEDKMHFSIYDGDNGPNVFLYCNGPHTSGGTYFEKIAFLWNTPGYNLDTCLYLKYWNNTARDCTFTDCPTAVNIQSLGCFLDHCTIEYGKNITTPTNVTAVVLAGINCEIAGPSEFNGNAVGGHTGSTDTAILIGGGVYSSNEFTIRRVHFDSWSYGIDYSDINDTGLQGGTQDAVISDCVFACTVTCVNLVPIGSNGQIFNQTFVNNTITKNVNSKNGRPLVFIDSNGGSNVNVGPIYLLNNTIYSNVLGGSGQGGPGGGSGVAQNNQYGVEIGTCNAVSIIGGQISQMGGNVATPTTGSANVCISGDGANVLIDGVNLSGTYEGANGGNNTGSTGSGPSYYGLLVTGNPGRVVVNNCNLSGLTVPVSVSIAGLPFVVPVFITNCQGYNDQNTVINTLPHLTLGMPYTAATAGSHGGTSYFGPSFVMFTAASSPGSSFQYNGGSPQILAPNQVVCLSLLSPNDTITFSGHVPVAFEWIGK